MILDDITEVLARGFEAIDAGFRGIHERFDRLEKLVRAGFAPVDRVAARVDSIEARLDRIEGMLAKALNG
jgi:hypothetical protein